MFLLSIFVLTVASCHVFTPPIDLAREIAVLGNLREGEVKTANFDIKIFYRLKNAQKDDVLNVYIEGDGNAWRDRFTPSQDPTPRKNPVSLTLASEDSANNVLYIARPCQYIMSDNCKVKYWTEARFAKETVQSLMEVIGKVKNQGQYKQINITGFSGGGTMAMLIGAMRDDVISIITVAAVLDHDKWTKFHKVTPLEASLNPANFADRISHIKQRHYCGLNDNISPCHLAEEFLQTYGANFDDAQLIEVEGAKHHCCWQGFRQQAVF